MITVELSNLDVILGELLAAILAINVKFGRAIYLAPYASSARLSILGNVSEAIFKEKSPALLKINNIIGRARGSHTRRDELIHAAWGLVKKRVHKRNLPLKDTRPSTPVELAHLTLLIRDIRVLITETFSLAQEICTSGVLDALHGRFPPQGPDATPQPNTPPINPLLTQIRPRPA